MIVRVWNKNIFKHSEKLKGDLIEIEPDSYVEMEEDDAHLFLGQFTPIVKRADGTTDPKSHKKLKIEYIEKPKYQLNPLICHATGQVAKSEAELREMNERYKHLLYKDEKLETKASEDIKGILTRLEESEKEKEDLKKKMDEILATLAEMTPKKRRKKDQEMEEIHE